VSGGGGAVEHGEVIAGLLGRIAELEGERDEYRKLYLLLREQYEKLKRGLVGQKAERLGRGENPAQLSLAMLGLLLGDGSEPEKAPSAAEIEVPAYQRKKAVRRPLPENLPHVTIEVLPPEVEREGRDAFEQIGCESRDVLERRPASVVVVEILKPKFIRKADRKDSPTTQVLVGETPELPIERGVAGPGMLADTVVRRWQDHLPLHRLESIYAREGVEIARSTLCRWHETLADLVTPLVEAMRIDARGQPYLCTDATGVLVMAPERCRMGHFWVLVAPGKHVLFEFSARHDGRAVDRLLGGYEGYLVADAHVVYDHLYKAGKVIEVGCWAHCRRYFFAARESDPERARWALERIGELFLLERAGARVRRSERQRLRQETGKPIVAGFFQWCEQQRDLVLDGSPMADAIRYALNQKEALERFLDDARLPLSNNISERHLRRQATGRKNWLFVGSEDGARANTTFVSLLASCQMHGIEPWGYLRDLFCLLPSWSNQRVLELAPAYWEQTLADPETQRRLEANVYRRILLADSAERVTPATAAA
jgi:transposase